MKVVRNNIFESNSSSSHSVSIRGKAKYNDLPPKNEEITVYPKEFGWDGPPCDDFNSKLTYAMQMILHTEYPESIVYEDNKYVDQDILEQCEGYQLLLKAIQKYTPTCKRIVIKREKAGGWGWYPYGYIDHQSCNYYSLADFLNDWNVDVERYLFDDDVIVHIDNDNH